MGPVPQPLQRRPGDAVRSPVAARWQRRAMRWAVFLLGLSRGLRSLCRAEATFVVMSGCFAARAKLTALLLDYYPRNSPHAAMVQPASETECLILVAAGVRMRLSLTTIKSCDWT